MPISEAIDAFTAKLRLEKSGSFVVAVSGGRDSICLLEALVDGGFSNLTVAHLNHGMRGDESEIDAEFVAEFCRSKAVRLIQESVNLSSLEKGIESAAREARYAFFDRVVAETMAEGVFIGHHGDDQAETILYNLFRGGDGLKGMQEVSSRGSGDKSYLLLRPLLSVRRADITQYVCEKKVCYREDATNQEGFTPRNRIRHELMPLVNDIMGRDVVPMVNRANIASHLQQQCIGEVVQQGRFYDPQGRLYVPTLVLSYQAVQQRVVFHYLQKHKVPQLSAELVSRALDLLNREEGGKINLPGGDYLRRRQQRLYIEPGVSSE